MKFSFVLTNLAGGGAEKAILKLSQALASRGYETEIVLLEERIDHTAPADVRIHALGRRLFRGWIGKRLLARRLRQHLAEGSSLVVSTLPFADEVALLADLPRHWCRIANTLGAEIDKLSASNPNKAWRRLARYRRLYGQRPLIAVSQGVALDLRERIGLSSRIEVIPNHFDFAAIRRAAKAQLSATRPYVLHVGRFSPQKRHDLLLDAWSRLDTDHELVLLTEPDPRLKAMIAKHQLEGRVKIAGFQPNPYPWIAHAELLVLCSDHEGLPNVLIEALACGTRVVSTDCPSGPREILRGELARGLVPCGDAVALAQAMRTALTQPKPAASALDAALAPFDAERVLAAWEALAQEHA